MRSLIPVAMTLALSVSLSGCQSAYYAAWEKVGVEKREILVDRVEDARDSQQEAEEQFTSALEEFSALLQFDGGELEEAYEALNDKYEASKKAADDVTNRIDKIESVAEALFDEWETELEQYSNASLKRTSQRKQHATCAVYAARQRSILKAQPECQCYWCASG